MSRDTPGVEYFVRKYLMIMNNTYYVLWNLGNQLQLYYMSFEKD